MFFMNAIMINHETMQICQDNLWLSKKGLDGESLVTGKFHQQCLCALWCLWAPDITMAAPTHICMVRK